MKLCHWARRLVIPVLGAGVFWCAGSTLAQSETRWTTNYYTVAGSTLPDIEASMRRSRPAQGQTEWQGFTKWNVTWRFTSQTSASGCQPTSFSVQTALTTTLPRWQGSTNATSLTRTNWIRFFQALSRHERGHAQFALDAATELRKRLDEVGEAADCLALRERIDALGKSVVDDAIAKEKQYDIDTRHGVSQGAALRSAWR
ncbi:MAG: DUF922 domain-containing protein [Verrucomicrobia bacterium]|nr:DUF922 domain-containing protein [Verrucomicrobiota bacterium]MBI3871362.1 DUF922 domain-containing protein [Verrucomicrobiota bacterium]